MQINNPGGAAVWGGITGTLTSQTDLNTALNGKRAVLAGNNLVYTTNGVGAQAQLSYSSATPSANSIMQRDASGRAYAVDPTGPTQVTTKAYTDAQFSPNTRAAVAALTGASTAAQIVTALQTL